MSDESAKDLTYSSVPDAMLARFPELRPQYDELRRKYSGEEHQPWFVTAVVSDVLRPHLDVLLRSADREQELKRVMAFIERLASDPDFNVRGLVAVEIAYPFFGLGRAPLLERARPFMGPETRERVREQELLATSGDVGLLQRLVVTVLALRNRITASKKGRGGRTS